MKRRDNQYDTMVEAIEALKTRGYTYNFKVDKGGLYFQQSPERFQPDEINIKEFHRFEGQSNPADMSIVYALEAPEGKKGILIDAFGTYSSEQIGAFLKAAEEADATH